MGRFSADATVIITNCSVSGDSSNKMLGAGMAVLCDPPIFAGADCGSLWDFAEGLGARGVADDLRKRPFIDEDFWRTLRAHLTVTVGFVFPLSSFGDAQMSVSDNREVSWGSTASQVVIEQEEWWDGRWRGISQSSGHGTSSKHGVSESGLSKSMHMEWAHLKQEQLSSTVAAGAPGRGTAHGIALLE